MRAKSLIIAILALLLLAAPAWAAPRPVWITEAHDGDTFTPLPALGSGPEIRLACADTPEMAGTRLARQPHAAEARDFAWALLAGRWASAEHAGWSYGREVMHIWTADNGDLAAQMVMHGWAWATVEGYPYCRAKAAELRAMEADARKAKVGLWADENPCPPSAWRKGQCK